jgi:CRP/FNR family cyclic AMP-dependent transcriptional regulator
MLDIHLVFTSITGAGLILSLGCNPQAGLQEYLQAFFACSTDVAASIGRRAIDRSYPVRALILKQGDRPDATFLMLLGRAQALTHRVDGHVVLLHEYLPGDFFGVIAQEAPAQEKADVVAVEDVRAAAFLALDFLTLIETHGCVGLAVSRMLLKQLRASAERMVECTTLSAAGRISAELLRLARLDDGQTVRPAPVLAALAVRVSSTRETVSRAINALERRGIIRREAEALTIVAPHRLEEMIV